MSTQASAVDFRLVEVGLTVVGEGSTILELFTSEDQSLLVRRNAFLVLDFGLDVVDSV